MTTPEIPAVPDFIKNVMPNFETEMRQHMAKAMEGALAQIDEEFVPTRLVQEYIASFGTMAATSFLMGAVYTYTKFSEALSQAASKAQPRDHP